MNQRTHYREKMYSQEKNEYLHYHIIDGVISSHQGIKNLKEEGIIDEHEYTTLLEKNVERLIDRIREFRIQEKMVCIFFALLFGYMQIAGDDIDMNRTGRASRAPRSQRGSRSGRGRSGRRDSLDVDNELPEYL
jgi:hypothetical protein